MIGTHGRRFVDRVGIELGVVVVGALVLHLLLKRLFPRLTSKTKSEFDDFLFAACADSVLPFSIIISVGLIVDNFPLPERFINGVHVLTTTAFIFFLARLINKVAGRFLRAVGRHSGDEDMQMLIASAMPLVRALVWILGGLICLQRWSADDGWLRRSVVLVLVLVLHSRSPSASSLLT